MSESSAMVRVVDVIFEMSDAGSERMLDLANQNVNDEHIIEHVLDTGELLENILNRVSSEDLTEHLLQNDDLELALGEMAATDIFDYTIHHYGIDEMLHNVDADTILEGLDNDEVVEWVKYNIDSHEIFDHFSNELLEYVLENRHLPSMVTALSNRYHDQQDTIRQTRENMSTQTYDFNRAQAKISDLVRTNEEQARIIALADASVDPMVAPTESDPDFAALLYDEQIIADRNVLSTELDASIEELAGVILGDNPTLVGNDPR